MVSLVALAPRGKGVKKIIIPVLLLALISAQGTGSSTGARYTTKDHSQWETRVTDSTEPGFPSEDVAIVPTVTRDEPLEELEPEESVRSDSLLAVAHAQAAAEREVSKLTWFGVGCAVNVAGFAIATLTTSPPPESHLMGRSPEYVEAFTTAYKEKSRNIQMVYAGWGCAASTGGCCVLSYIVLIDWSKSLSEAIGLFFLEWLLDAFFGG